MIEKLDLRENVEIIPIKGSCHDYCLAKSSVLIKINELVDAVNELQKDYDNICVWVGEQKLKALAKNVQDSAICNTYTHIRWDELCRLKEIADKYAEITGHKGGDNDE